MSAKIRLNPLEEAASVLIDEIWDRKWDHVPEVKTKPIDQWTAIPAELQRRCPGYSAEQYPRAVRKGMIRYR